MRRGLRAARKKLFDLDRRTSYDVGGALSAAPRYERVENTVIREAIALREQGAFAEAAEAISDAASAEVVNGDPSALVTRALAHADMGRFDAALEYLGTAEQRLRAQLGMLEGNRSIFLGLEGRHEEALRAAQRAVELLPERGDISTDLMVAYELCGCEERAEEELQRIASVLAEMPETERVEAAGYFESRAGLDALWARTNVRKELGLPG